MALPTVVYQTNDGNCLVIRDGDDMIVVNAKKRIVRNISSNGDSCEIQIAIENILNLHREMDSDLKLLCDA